MSQQIRCQGGYLVFSDRPEQQKLSRGRWNFASCQVSLNAVQQFQRRSRKHFSQSETRAAILIFGSAQKHKLCREFWDLASCQVSWNSVQQFQRRSQTCVKVTTDDSRRTVDGRTIVHLSIRLRCTNNISYTVFPGGYENKLGQWKKGTIQTFFDQLFFRKTVKHCVTN